MSGVIGGRVDEVWPNSAAFRFTFVGTDEGDEVGGAAAVAYRDKGNAIAGTMWCHQRCDLPFVWRRMV